MVVLIERTQSGGGWGGGCFWQGPMGCLGGGRDSPSKGVVVNPIQWSCPPPIVGAPGLRSRQELPIQLNFGLSSNHLALVTILFLINQTLALLQFSLSATISGGLLRN